MAPKKCSPKKVMIARFLSYKHQIRRSLLTNCKDFAYDKITEHISQILLQKRFCSNSPKKTIEGVGVTIGTY